MFPEKVPELACITTGEPPPQRAQQASTAAPWRAKHASNIQRRCEFRDVNRRNRLGPFVFAVTHKRADTVSKIVAHEDQFALRTIWAERKRRSPLVRSSRRTTLLDPKIKFATDPIGGCP